MVHSVDGYTFLKVDPLNFLHFNCQDPANRLVSVVQEWRQETEDGTNTLYDNIFNIRIHDITLRELLIL
jgi:hypothetical protein